MRPSREGSDMPEADQHALLGTVSAISLFVEDPVEAKAFYRDVFGVDVVFEDDTSVCVKFGELFVNLLADSAAHELVAPGVVAGRNAGSRFQLSIWVDDVDAVCAFLDRRGVELLTGPTDRHWGVRTATFVDPAGHSWEVAQSLSREEDAA